MAQPPELPPPPPDALYAPPPPSFFDFEADYPPGWVDQDKGPAIIATIVTVTVLSTVFAAARLYVRGGIMKKLQLDDYIIIVAVVRSRLVPLVSRLAYCRCGWKKTC